MAQLPDRSMIVVQPQPDGNAVLLWQGSPVAQMRSFHSTWEGIEASGFELLTHGGLHLSSLQPQTLIDELTDRINAKLSGVPLTSKYPADWRTRGIGGG